MAEALTLLPVLSPLPSGALPWAAPFQSGGLAFRSQPHRLYDAVCGTFATLLAALASYRLRNLRWFGLPVLSALAPVLCNGIIIGAELSILVTGSLSLSALLINGAYVAAGG